MAGSRRRLLIALAIVAGLLLAARLAATIFADHAWYVAAGAGPLWRARFWNAVALHGTTWLAGTAFAFANLYAVRSSVLRFALPRRVADLDIAAEIPGRLLVGVAALVAAGIGALLTFVQASWTRLAVFRYLARTDIERDPHLGGDIASFWIGWLPLEQAWYSWAQASLVAVSCLVVVLYGLTSSLRWERGSLHVNTHVRRHLSVLGALLLLLLAWGYRLERFLLLVNGGREGSDGFVGYTDVRVTLTALLVLSVLTAACAFLVAWAGYTGQTRIAFGGVTVVIIMAITLQQIVPSASRWMARGVAEAVRVAPYRSIQESFTQRAYGLDSTFHVGDSAWRFSRLAAVAGRVSVWDPATVRAAAERESRRRVPVGGLGWRAGEHGLEAVVTLREAGADSALRAEGWAVAVVAAAEVADDGTGESPRVRVRPVAPVRLWPDAPGYAVVADDDGALAAPRLGSGWRRLAFALSTQNLRLLLDRGSDANARLLRHRDLGAWLARLAPVFRQGADVTPLLDGDSLYWAVPLYTSARTYPLSVPLAVTLRGSPATDPEPTKYFHHAATAVVNAHTGRVAFVPAPTLDPLAQAWFSRFPQQVRDAARLSPTLLAQLPPPRESGLARVLAFTRVGTVAHDPLSLLVAAPAGSDSALDSSEALPRLAPAQPLPVLDVPLVRGDDERIAALASLSGGPEPRLVVNRLDAPGSAWSEVVTRLRQAPPEAPGDDSRTQRGRVRVLPTDSGLVYVQPRYRIAFDAVPVLDGVVVLARDSVRYGPTLRAAVGAPAADTASTSPAGAAPRAVEPPAVLYRRMQDALRRADWEAFGAAFRALGRTLGVPERP